MNINSSNHFDYETTHYSEFNTILEKIIKEEKIKDIFINIETSKLNKKYNQCITLYEGHKSYNTNDIPDDNRQFYNFLYQDALNSAKGTKEFATAFKTIAILGLGFESSHVQDYLNNLRKELLKEKEELFSTTQTYIKEIFEKALKNTSKSVRVLKKEITVIYFSPKQPSTTFSLTYLKFRDQECDYCHAWRTTAHKLYKCTRCLESYYCDKECQKQDWKSHRLVCVKK